MIGPFRVGDHPGDPLEITITRSADSAPMSGFDTARIEMLSPAGALTDWAATITGDVVSAAFPTAFALIGRYKVRAHLTGPGGASEFTEWARFWVRPAA